MSGCIARDELIARVLAHLQTIYHGCEHRQSRQLELAEELCRIMRFGSSTARPAPHHNNWDQSDVAVITYGDTVQRDGEVPLRTLRRFLDEKLLDTVSIIHILPFFPWSSDDGFAVIDYEKVNPRMGSWSHIEDIAGEFRLMADLVINHCSSEHEWFAQFERDEEPGRSMFFCASPDDDLEAVVRPRTSPLLRPTATPAGTRYVWCTFGHDQVDFDFCNPRVLCEFVKIIRHYLDHGVQVFRLDAVAFLWKRIGTSCLNLEETHEMVRLLRTLIEHADSNAMIITETNIPNRENLAYFGNANEAHCIYNFSLPPLLVNTMVAGNCRHLKNWMMSMPPAQNGTCYFNFIASHDGLGLRPAEGLLSDEELHELIRVMQESGGCVSWRALENGETRPYEINISLYDAMARTVQGPDEWQLQRFICVHTIMLGLEGIPAFYLQSLLGSTNDYERLQRTGHKRHINRRQWDYATLMQALDDGELHHGAVLASLSQLINLRRQQPAFHPNATQYVLHLGEEVFAFWRQSLDRDQSVFCLNNVTEREQNINLADINLIETKGWQDLISGVKVNNLRGALALAPYQSVWLASV